MSRKTVSRDKIPGTGSANRGSQNSNLLPGSFLNPIGSAGSSSYRDTEPSSDVMYQVLGDGGSVRHAGSFSRNNPYYEQLQLATNNQDKDALYELAIQWEADYANLSEQREYARGVLEEQRSYDDPSSVVARQRAAGINPDLVGGSAGGSSAGGSSAQLAQPQMADQTGQTKFSNSYDNISLVQSGFQTAASVLSSLSSFGSSVVGSISTFKKLPSEINLADATASAANATADATRQLTPIQAAAGHLTNLNSALSIFDKASNIISPDTSLEGAKSIFSSVGIPDEQHEGLYNSIKAYHENPSMRNYFARNEREARDNEEYNKVYTSSVVNGMIEVGKEIQDATLAYDKDIAILKSGITRLLDLNKLSADNAGIIQKSTQITAEQQELQYKQVKRDIEAFVANLDDLKKAQERSQNLIDDIKNRAKQRAGKNIKGEDNPVKYSAPEKALIEIEEQRIKHYNSLGSMSLGEVYSMMAQTSSNDYYRDVNFDPSGNLEPIPGIQKHQLFMRYAWSDYSSGRVTSDKLTKSLVSRIPLVGDLASMAFDTLE